MLIAIMIVNIILWSVVIAGLLLVVGRSERALDAQLARLDAAFADSDRPQGGAH
jgi:hypothetical protein